MVVALTRYLFLGGETGFSVTLGRKMVTEMIGASEEENKKEKKKEKGITDHITFNAPSSPHIPRSPPMAIPPMVQPRRPSCIAVLTLLIPVGCTSALGRLKSQ